MCALQFSAVVLLEMCTVVTLDTPNYSGLNSVEVSSFLEAFGGLSSSCLCSMKFHLLERVLVCIKGLSLGSSCRKETEEVKDNQLPFGEYDHLVSCIISAHSPLVRI